MKALVRFDVLIVGGGFSGTMLAVQLLRQSSALSIAILDRDSLPGRGLAYRSPHRFHILTVPAGEMSAFPDVPDDFLRWAKVHFDAGMQERSFPPRSVYGEYIGDVLERTLAETGVDHFRWLQGHAMFLRSRGAGLYVQTEAGAQFAARVVVLATGNFPAGNPQVKGLEASSAAYHQSPWAPDSVENLNRFGSVLLLGSGLASLDVIMALKSKGFRGTIHVLSRKGLFPQARRQTRPTEPWTVFWDERSPRTVRRLMRLVRSQVNLASEQGVDWRAVIDSLRPVTQAIWRSLPLEERRRFLRHVRSFWDVHRHRAAPEIADLLADMRWEGQVRLHTGVLTGYSGRSTGAEVVFWDRETQADKTLEIDRVINCTGSETDWRRIGDSLVSSLFAQGLARPDPLFLGLDAGKCGSLIDHRGNVSSNLFAMGPPLKGTLWETTSVREIRQQAFELAQHLSGSLKYDQNVHRQEKAVLERGKIPRENMQERRAVR